MKSAPVKLPDQQSAPEKKSGKYKDRSKVPSRFIHAALRHDINITGSLFEYHIDNGDLDFEVFRQIHPAKIQEFLKDYENTFTGHELEMIVAAYHRAGESGRAEFKSVNEWITISAGGRGSDRTKYLESIKTIQEPHWILDFHKHRYIITHIPPVIVSKKRTIDESGKIEYSIVVHISKVIRQNIKSFHMVPLALAKLLRSGGLKRVQTAHIKLYLYILTRVKSRKPQHTLDMNNIYAAAGLMDYFKHCHGNRARQLISNGLDAMKKAMILDRWKPLGGSHIEIEPNPFHFNKRVKLS